MSQHESEVIEIFAHAITIESLKEREAFLDEKCGSNRELRAQVLRLLMAHSNGDSLVVRAAFTLQRLLTKYLPRISVRKAVCGFLVVTVIAAIVVYYCTNYGELIVTNRDPHTIVTLNGKPLSFTPGKVNDPAAGSGVLKVWPGEHRLHVQKGDLEFETDSFCIRRDKEVRISIRTQQGQLR